MILHVGAFVRANVTQEEQEEVWNDRQIEVAGEPRGYLDLCGQVYASESRLCDPHSFLSNEEHVIIDGHLKILSNEMELIVVVIGSINTTGMNSQASTVEIFGNALLDDFQLKSNNNNSIGMVMILSINDRAIYFASSEDLGNTLSAEFLSELVDNMRPFLQSNHYSSALSSSVVSIIDRMKEGKRIIPTELNHKSINNNTGTVVNDWILPENSANSGKLENTSSNDDTDGNDNDDGSDGPGDLLIRNFDADDDALAAVRGYAIQQYNENIVNKVLWGGLIGTVGLATVSKARFFFRPRSSRKHQTVSKTSAAMMPQPVAIQTSKAVGSSMQRKKPNSSNLDQFDAFTQSSVVTYSKIPSSQDKTLLCFHLEKEYPSKNFADSRLRPVDQGRSSDVTICNQPISQQQNGFYDPQRRESEEQRSEINGFESRFSNLPESAGALEVSQVARKGRWMLARRILHYVEPVEKQFESSADR
jgi:hypothetical protein